MLKEHDVEAWNKVDFSKFYADDKGTFNMVSYWDVIHFVREVKAIRDEQLKRFPSLLRKEI